MTDVRIVLDGPAAVEPGSGISGNVEWSLASPASIIHVRLFWYTEGKGDRDLSVVEETDLPVSAATGRTPFRFRIPEGPYSFAGELISLIWAIEAIAEPSGSTGREEITVGPGGRERRIGKDMLNEDLRT